MNISFSQYSTNISAPSKIDKNRTDLIFGRIKWFDESKIYLLQNKKLWIQIKQLFQNFLNSKNEENWTKFVEFLNVSFEKENSVFVKTILSQIIFNCDMILENEFWLRWNFEDQNVYYRLFKKSYIIVWAMIKAKKISLEQIANIQSKTFNDLYLETKQFWFSPEEQFSLINFVSFNHKIFVQLLKKYDAQLYNKVGLYNPLDKENKNSSVKTSEQKKSEKPNIKF